MNGRAARHEERLAAGVPVAALGDADQGHVASHADFRERLPGRVELALAAVDEHEVGPGREAVDRPRGSGTGSGGPPSERAAAAASSRRARRFLHEAREAALQHSLIMP